jgi:ATP/ADP translocase
VVDGLPILAVMHLLCMVATLVVARGAPVPRLAVATEQSGGLTVLKSHRYVQRLAALVVAGALSGEVVDYLFKSMAADNWQGDQLMRLFAVAYGVMEVATFVGQSLITQRVLQRLSLGKTAAVRPALMGVGALVGVLVPRLPAAVGLWGTR